MCGVGGACYFKQDGQRRASSCDKEGLRECGSEHSDSQGGSILARKTPGREDSC